MAHGAQPDWQDRRRLKNLRTCEKVDEDTLISFWDISCYGGLEKTSRIDRKVWKHFELFTRFNRMSIIHL
jgi:hypothetical protein